MKYQVLARKYRPKTFAAMVGQEHVLKALSNALKTERLHHAYLFTGTRGVGKTTLARVLAKALNCEQGITAEPCGECSACQEIDQGRFVDLIEVDAASRTKVEDTRELLNNVQYAPTRGRFKIYLIDEVHMLSASSFNALLKTLEEPPPHVKFLLATTDPQKLPVTILSRCLQFNLKYLTIEQIEQQLSLILNAEAISFDDNILKPLAIAADGSMRDALSLLDQAIAYCNDKPNLSDIEIMLGSVQKDRIFELLTALAHDDGQSLINQSRILITQGLDVNTVLAELITMLQRIALCQQVPDVIDDSQGDKKSLEQIAALISAEDIQLFYQIALNGRKDLPYSPQPQGGFEMILLRMLAFKPVVAGKQAKVHGKQTKVSAKQPEVKVEVVKTVEELHSSSNSNQTHKTHLSVALQSAASQSAALQSQSEDRGKQPGLSQTQKHNKVPVQTNNSIPDDLELPPVDAYSQEDFYSSTVHEMSLHEMGELPPLAEPEVNYNTTVAASSEQQLSPEPQDLEKKLSVEESEHLKYNITEISQPLPEAADTQKKNLISADISNKNEIKETSADIPDIKIPCIETLSDELAAYWYDLIIQSKVSGLVQQLGKHCALISKKTHDNQLVLELLLESVHKHLLNDKIKIRLQDALQQVLSSELSLDIKECQLKAEDQLQTPRRREIQAAEILQQEAVKSIYADEKVEMLVNAFSAEVRAETIKPNSYHTIH